MTTTQRCLITISLIFLTACNLPTQPALKPAAAGETPTDCGCSSGTTGAATPTGGLSLQGPAAPAKPVTTSESPTTGNWIQYTNPTFHFSFEYPAVYNNGDYGFCAARDVTSLPPGAVYVLALGSRTTLTLFPAAGDLPAAIAAFQAGPSRKDAQFDAPRQRTVAGLPALTLGYRAGGTNRYAEAAFFINQAILYQVETGIPSACDVPAKNLRELDAYTHLLDTFSFTK